MSDKKKDNSKNIASVEKASNNLEGWQNKKISFVIAIFSLIIVAFAFFVSGYFIGNSSGVNLNTSVTTSQSSNLTKNQIAQKTIDYITRNLIDSKTYSIKLDDINSEGNSLYNIQMTVFKGDQRLQQTNVYVTSDGKNLILGSVLDLSKDLPKQTTPPSQEFKPEKNDTPTVLLFTMSFCPYGNQAEDNFEPVASLLKDKINFEPHYIINESSQPNERCSEFDGTYYCSLHGTQELHQDIRELCVLKYNKDKYWPFVLAVNKNCSANDADSCWEEQAANLGLNTDDIKSCYDSEAVSLIKSEIELTQKYSVSGSPTLIINDSVYNGNRTPAAYKTATCTAFNSAPAECDQNMDDSTASVTGSCA